MTSLDQLQRQLEEARTRTRDFADLIPQMLFEADLEGRIGFANRALLETFGQADGSAPGLNLFALFAAPDRDRLKENLLRLLAGEKFGTTEYAAVRRDGSIFPVIMQLLVVPVPGRDPLLRGTIVNISERRRDEANFEGTVAVLRTTFESVDEGLLVVNDVGAIEIFNRKFIDLMQIPDRIVALPDVKVMEFVIDGLASPDEFVERLAALQAEPDATSSDVCECGDGRVLEIASQPQYIGGRNVGRVWSFRDITARQRAEEQLTASLHEKEVLIKEIHHRVKNNMQIISSMLNLQSRCIQDPAVRQLLRESQDRIRSMALIHEKLYQSKDLSRVNFREYLGNLVSHLFRSCAGAAVTPHLTVDEVFLSVDSAVPCGLIINELVSNALKHAFAGREKGTVGITFTAEEKKGKLACRFSVKDDGVGFPEGRDFRATESLGMQLVVTLVEQLEGTIELTRGNGTEFTVAFSGDTLGKRREA